MGTLALMSDTSKHDKPWSAGRGTSCIEWFIGGTMGSVLDADLLFERTPFHYHHGEPDACH